MLLQVGFYAKSQEISINEIVSENESFLIDEDGDYSDWIELYNSGATSVDLTDMQISDDNSVLGQWIFSSITLDPNDFLIVFCSGKDRNTGPYLHTNFKLKSSGEKLILSTNAGQILDEVKATPLGEDISLARVIDGTGAWERFSEATPNSSNQVIGAVVFTHAPGYYENQFLLGLESTLGHEIRYSLNGSEPTANSPIYSSLIPITDLIGTASIFSGISTSSSWQTPSGSFPKVNVVRARTFSNSLPTSQVFSKTYMIDPEVEGLLVDYPIVSIITDSLNLFDFDTGLFVSGVNYNPANSVWTGNYFMKGPEWERHAHIEYFQNESLEWSQNFGLRIHGGKTRRAPQKSLRLYAREEVGAKKFNHQFFETKDKTVFDKILFRAHFGCWNETMIKDALTGYVARNLDFETQHAQPVIVFINGEYWGIQTVRDFYDSNYIEEEYNIDKEDVNIVLHGAGTNPDFPPEWGVVEGSHAHYVAMMDFVENNSLAIQSNYEYVLTQLDVSSMIDYFCTAIYFNHKDWPTNNHKVWRGTGDSKWRWLLYDFDSGWGYTSVANNSILYAAHPTGSTIYNPPYATLLFRSMLESPQFQEDFVHRYACLMNNEFSEDTVDAAIDHFEWMYDNNAEQHINRWHHVGSYSTWQSRVNSKLRVFNEQRRLYAINHVSDWFDIDFDPDTYECSSIVTIAPDLELTKNLQIYPNPSSELVWVDWKDASPNALLRVVDIAGSVVFSEKYTFHQSLNTGSLNAGIYMAILDDAGTRVTKKFIVQ